MTADASPLNPACPLCRSARLMDIFQLESVPVICNQLWPSAEEARAAASCDIDLAYCETCSLVSNRTFRDDRIAYAPGYENALHFSPSFQAFADQLSTDLVRKYDLAGKDIVEIGCGDGHILDLMVRKGVRSATGFDPSMAGKPSVFTETKGVEIVPEHFRPDQLDRHFDALLCRHVLEHLPDPLAVLTDIRAAIGDRYCPVYFEVPNAQWMLDSCSMWDVIYEHVTYWTAPSLRTLFLRAGFEPVSVRAGYRGQFLMIEAKPATPQPDFLPAAAKLEEVKRACLKFSRTSAAVLSEWRDRLEELGREAKRVVIWGAGSKGITFANAVDKDGKCLTAMIDLNPRKHGMFAPGIALPVTAPSMIAEIAPDNVLISNELYAGEITRIIRDLGLSPELSVIAG